MKISVDWVKEFVDLKPPFPEHALALTEAGLEVEAVEKSASGDTVFQVEVTTNRPDWLSHWGVARELAAIHGLAFGKPVIVDEKKMSRTPPAGWKVISKDSAEACPYYTGVLIEGITEHKTPDFMKRRLESCGLRSIHLIVDITNYVLLELGQPLHAFDADLLSGNQIVIRRARKGEKMNLISGSAIELHEHDLLIADDSKPLALAGVMGGKDSEINERSRNIFLETAHFQPRLVRESARRHQLSTDSSYRFERRVDPCLVDLARLRALYLIQEYAKPRHISGAIHFGQTPNPVLSTLNLSEDEIQKALGCEVKGNQTVSILNRLGLEVKTVSSKAWKVTIPSFRADLTRPIDLVEEVARIYGFNKIPETLPALPPGSVQVNPVRKIQKKIRESLVGAGFHEAVTFSLISGDGFSDAELSAMVRLRNPLQAGLEWMRPTLLPGLLQAVQKNIRFGSESIRLFEVANTYRKNTGKEVVECKTVALILSGKVNSGRWLDTAREASYFDLKGAVINLLEKAGLNDAAWLKSTATGLSASVCETISMGEKTLGFAGQVSPEWLKTFDIQAPVFYAEVKVETLLANTSFKKVYSEVSRYPVMRRDLSMTVPDDVYCDQMVRDIRLSGGTLVGEVQLLDLFQGGRVAKGYKNFTFRLTYLSPDRTLTSDEVDALQTQIAQTLAVKYQAQFQTK